MTTGTLPPAVSDAVAEADAALARLQDAVSRFAEGDLARAHRGGGWSVAQVISHINVSAILWAGDIARLAADPDLGFFFREEIGHDALGYPPPTAEIAGRQLAATRRTLATTTAAVPAEIMARTVEIPDLGTMTVADWIPLIIGHATGHVNQAFEIMQDRDFLPAGV